MLIFHPYQIFFRIFSHQVSIKQLPGPISLLNIPEDFVEFLIKVILDMPPIFKIQTGKFDFFF